MPTPVSINSESDGSIELIITGGYPPYTYNWSNGATSKNIDNLQVGQYSVTVTDNEGYEISESTTVQKLEVLSMTLTPTNNTVFGGNDGSIDLTMNSGLPPFKFLWSNGDTTEDIFNLTSGLYSVLVQDLYGQSIFDSIAVNDPVISTFDLEEITDHLFFIQQPGQSQSNVGIYTYDNGSLIVDSGVEGFKTRLENTLMVLNPNPLTHIFNTHADADHIGGNSILPNNGTVICHENAKWDVRNNNPNALIVGISNKTIYEIGNEIIECYPLILNGHTDTDMFIYFKNSNTLFLGDEYLSESFPSVSTVRGARVQNNISNMEFVLNNFPQDAKIVPGHGKLSSVNELDDYLSMIQETINIVITHMQLEKDIDTIIAEDVLKDYNDWGSHLPGLDNSFWITAIYYSYLNTI